MHDDYQAMCLLSRIELLQNKRCHRLQHKYTERGADALITFCNFLFLNNLVTWTGQTRRVTFDELLNFLHTSGNVAELLERNTQNTQTSLASREMVTKNQLQGIMLTLQGDGNLWMKLKIFKDFGIEVIDADDHSLSSPRMTIDTLNALYRQTKEEELCILVRNGYFSTITKSNGIIFEFVTAESVVDADPQTTWWTLLSTFKIEKRTSPERWGNSFELFILNMFYLILQG